MRLLAGNIVFIMIALDQEKEWDNRPMRQS